MRRVVEASAPGAGDNLPAPAGAPEPVTVEGRPPFCPKHRRTLLCPACQGEAAHAAKLRKFGIRKLRKIARENGKRGGRPVGAGDRKPRKPRAWEKVTL